MEGHVATLALYSLFPPKVTLLPVTRPQRALLPTQLRRMEAGRARARGAAWGVLAVDTVARGASPTPDTFV